MGLLIFAYLVVALVGTLWTVSSDRAQAAAAATRTVFVLSNGFHTDIALPLTGGEAPRGLPIAASDLVRGLSGVRYVAIGWGSEAAYTSLVSITDLSAGTIFRALAFDRSVVHVLPYYAEPFGEGVYRLELSEDQYRRLTDFIATTFLAGPDGAAEIIPGVSQGFGDVFYRGRPRFSAFYGCNAWTGEALRRAGAEVGIWTPFAQSIEWALSR